MSSYELSLFLHVTAVVVGFGATFAESIMFPVAMKLDKRHLPYLHRVRRGINQWLATPGLVVVIATGIYQTSEGNWDFGGFWISANACDRDHLGRPERRLLHPDRSQA